MARKKPTGKTASVLLFLCLLLVTAVSGVWARGGPRAQLVLVLDFSRMAGTVTVHSAQGGWSGVFINPAPGAAIILRSPGCQDLCLAELHLNGPAPGGPPLHIASRPLRLKTSQEVSDDPAKSPLKPGPAKQIPRQNTPSLIQKFSQRWVWLALSAMGGVVLLVSALLMLRLRREADGSEGEEDSDGSSRKSILRIKAQVENLTREKAELAAALKEKNQEINRLQGEKTGLQEDLQRSQKKYQDNLKTLKDMEKKLEEAESEAKGIKQEYMALYARNQREKESLKKN